MGRKGKLRAALGATAGALAWALAVLLLNGWLGWPSSWPTLLAAGGLAFLASAAASWALRGPWAARAGAVCTLALLVSCPLAGWPFGVAPRREKGRYETRFAYFITYILGTEDNEPLDNVCIAYLCPNIDNKCPEINGEPVIYSTWVLHYLADNGDLLPQVQFRWSEESGWEYEIYQFYGERGAPPTVLKCGISPITPFGPTTGIVLDRLYPREVLWEVCGVDVPADKKENLTLRVAGFKDNISLARLGYENSSRVVYPYNKKIHVRFVAQLWRPISENTLQRVEFYQREIEYYGEAGVGLLPPV